MSKKAPQNTDSAFSRFFRNASKAEREAMFSKVGEQATKAQQHTLKVSAAITTAADLTQRLMDDLTDEQAALDLHLLMESFNQEDQVTITKRACEVLIQRRTQQ